MRAFGFAAGLLASTLISASSAAPSALKPRAGTAQIVTYYGAGANQPDLFNFCGNDVDSNAADVIPIGFVSGFPGNGGTPETNFGNQCGGYYPGTKIFAGCQNFIRDIPVCQAKGKKILISLGGASSVSLDSDAQARDFADQLWKWFGPKQCGYTGPRPFGDFVVDGFDLDIESNGDRGIPALAGRLRELMDADTSKTYILTAAPQCVVPDAQLATAIRTVRFDQIHVQFYNTDYCSARAGVDKTGAFSYKDWSRQLDAGVSKNAKLFIGLPASKTSSTGDDTGTRFYLEPSEVQSLVSQVADAKFGGIMLFDASSSKQNQIGGKSYAANIRDALANDGYAAPFNQPIQSHASSCISSTTNTTTTTTTTTTTPTTTTTTTTTTKTTVPSTTTTTTTTTASSATTPSTTTATPPTTVATTTTTTAATETTTTTTTSVPTTTTTTSKLTTSTTFSESSASSAATTTTVSAVLTSATTTTISKSTTTSEGKVTGASSSLSSSKISTASEATTGISTTVSAVLTSATTTTTSDSTTTTRAATTSSVSSSTTTESTSAVGWTTGTSVTVSAVLTSSTTVASSTTESTIGTSTTVSAVLTSATTQSSTGTSTTVSAVLTSATTKSSTTGPASSSTHTSISGQSTSTTTSSGTSIETSTTKGPIVTGTSSASYTVTTSLSVSTSSTIGTVSISSQVWSEWPEASSTTADTVSVSSQVWSEWRETSSATTSKPVDPITTADDIGTWGVWSTTTSKPVDPITTTDAENWGVWSTTTSKPIDPITTTDDIGTWGVWSTTTSTTPTKKSEDPHYTTSTAISSWGVWSDPSKSVTVTTVITSYTYICPTGFATGTYTLTTTIPAVPVTLTKATGSASVPASSGWAWPTGKDGVPTGFYTTATVCTVCGATPTTVTLTLPTVGGEKTISIVPVKPTGTLTGTVTGVVTVTGTFTNTAGVTTVTGSVTGAGSSVSSGSGWSTAIKPSTLTVDPAKSSTAATASGSGSWSSGVGTGSGLGSGSGSGSGNNGIIAPWTGGAGSAADQLPGTVLSVAVCLVLAVGGLLF